MMQRRTFLKQALAGGAALAGSPAIIHAARAAEPITVITPFGFIPDFIEVMNAAAGGHFAKAGLDARIIGGHGAAQATQQIVGGQAQFARNAGIDLIGAVGKQNLPLVSVMTLYQGATFQLASLKEKPIRDARDLKGKTVGIVSVGGSTETFLDLILAKAGLKKDDVRREVVGNSPGAVQFIRQGRIDCFICSINVVVTLERAGQPITYWSMDKYAPMPGQVYMATRETVTGRPDLALRFTRAMKASVGEIMAEPLAPIFERAAKQFDIPGLKDMAAAVAIEKISIRRLWLSEGKQNLLRNVPALWQSGVDALHGIGQIAMADASQLYTNTFVDEVAKG